ncbi:Uncharacterised protein [Burkholderia pseudomallei]|nr:Uncharacterised protein [Burkholderia pseudomallei]CAJ6264672.1 Uncharacterised protein [Burkholderia pseudomallei]
MHDARRSRGAHRAKRQSAPEAPAARIRAPLHVDRKRNRFAHGAASSSPCGDASARRSPASNIRRPGSCVAGYGGRLPAPARRASRHEGALRQPRNMRGSPRNARRGHARHRRSALFGADRRHPRSGRALLLSGRTKLHRKRFIHPPKNPALPGRRRIKIAKIIPILFSIPSESFPKKQRLKLRYLKIIFIKTIERRSNSPPSFIDIPGYIPRLQRKTRHTARRHSDASLRPVPYGCLPFDEGASS